MERMVEPGGGVDASCARREGRRQRCVCGPTCVLRRQYVWNGCRDAVPLPTQGETRTAACCLLQPPPLVQARGPPPWRFCPVHTTTNTTFPRFPPRSSSRHSREQHKPRPVATSRTLFPPRHTNISALSAAAAGAPRSGRADQQHGAQEEGGWQEGKTSKHAAQHPGSKWLGTVQRPSPGPPRRTQQHDHVCVLWLTVPA